jgi:hypothetical protein
MNRRKFLNVAGATILLVSGATYLICDRKSLVRGNVRDDDQKNIILKPDEKEILYLASLAPSGHNTQPWFVKYIEPFHWIIGNDKDRWLPAVDPTQRETMLSIGAFIQNLELAANVAGYSCDLTLLATTNQDEQVLEVRLKKSAALSYDINKLKMRRTVRSGYLNESLQNNDESFLTSVEKDAFYYISNDSKEYQWLNEQTIEANRIQAYRDVAQKELAEWIRFSNKETMHHRDGLTTAGMEIDGLAGLIVRNFYHKEDVMKNGFREKGIDKVKKQVSNSAGWLIITSKDATVSSLLETGKRFQKMFLKVRDRNIAIHPMTQILEEPHTQQAVNSSLGISGSIQFILRSGYVKNYPEPVSMRRPVDWFVRT